MPSSRSRSRGGDDRLREGDEVEADYRGKGKYYPARVARVHRDGTVDVKYDDGDIGHSQAGDIAVTLPSFTGGSLLSEHV